MYCSNCGKPIKEGDRFCSECGAEQKSEIEAPVHSVVSDNDGDDGKEVKEVNEISEKTYNFGSALYMCFSITWGRIFSDITLDREKLSISTDPKRKNKYPTVYLSDIMDVGVNFAVSNYCLYGAIYVAVAGMFVDPLYCFFGALLVFWLGTNWKIGIQTKGGEEVKIYSVSKRRAKRFRDDLLEILKG